MNITLKHMLLTTTGIAAVFFMTVEGAYAQDGADNKPHCSVTNSCPPPPPQSPPPACEADNSCPPPPPRYNCWDDTDRHEDWEEDTELFEHLHTGDVRTMKPYCNRSQMYRGKDWQTYPVGSTGGSGVDVTGFEDYME